MNVRTISAGFCIYYVYRNLPDPENLRSQQAIIIECCDCVSL